MTMEKIKSMLAKGAEAGGEGTALSGYLGKGAEMEGVLRHDGTLRVEGRFKGEIFSTGTLIVGEGGRVEGKIHAAVAIVSGEVEGTLEAQTRVELNGGARMLGEVITPTLIVSEGAFFDGSCNMGEGRAPALTAPERDD